MSIEENVRETNDQTEEIAKANAEPAEASKVASTDLGKFKDVDALLSAYESLQAEFTRRSQRLRTLEKEAENFKSLEGASGAEKLRKTAKSRREAAKKFDEFVAGVHTPTKEKPDSVFENPSQEDVEGVVDPIEEGGKAAKREEAFVASGSPDLQAESKVGYGGENSSAEKSEESLSAEEIYKRASSNEEVRLRIVGEYLASIGKSGAPLTGGGAGVALTPPSKAKTVGQAGNMALLYFRRPTID